MHYIILLIGIVALSVNLFEVLLPSGGASMAGGMASGGLIGVNAGVAACLIGGLALLGKIEDGGPKIVAIIGITLLLVALGLFGFVVLS